MSNIYGWPDDLVVEFVGGPRDGERQRGPHVNALPCGSSHYLPLRLGGAWARATQRLPLGATARPRCLP